VDEQEGGLRGVISVKDHHILQGIARTRWKSHKKRCDELGLTPPDESDILILLIESFNNGLVCPYCGKTMCLRSSWPPKDVVSIDHKIALRPWGGSSKRENLVICCTQCNLVKGTIKDDTFKEVMDKMPQELKQRYLDEAYAGQLAYKIKRMGDEGPHPDESPDEEEEREREENFYANGGK